MNGEKIGQLTQCSKIYPFQSIFLYHRFFMDFLKLIHWYFVFLGMFGRLCFWQLLVISNYGLLEAKPAASAKPSILEVSVGETAKLFCPSNDDNHRFQFWQLKSNEILGPGNKIDERKYKYEVLSGTLYIKVKW